MLDKPTINGCVIPIESGSLQIFGGEWHENSIGRAFGLILRLSVAS